MSDALPPDCTTLGAPLHYRTTLSQLGSAIGVTVEGHDAHPTQIEGNPEHAESLGATTVQARAALFDLYDADRSQHPLEHGEARTWADAERMLEDLRRDSMGDEGAGLTVLVDPIRSPTLELQLSKLRSQYPKARVLRYAALDQYEAVAGAKLVYRRPMETVIDWTSVERALVFDGDPFGTDRGALPASAGWAEARTAHRERCRLWVIESSWSLTGAVADQRWACESSFVGPLLARLALSLQQHLGFELPEDLQDLLAELSTPCENTVWGTRIDRLASDLCSAPSRSVVALGARQPAGLHGLVHVLNRALGSLGSLVCLRECFDECHSLRDPLQQLARDLQAGSVRSLLILGTNPVFSSSGDIDMASAIRSAKKSIHVGMHVDESAKVCQWHLNMAHDLESWGDAVSVGGTTSIIQPLVVPLWGGRTASEVIARLLGTPQTALELVRSTWRSRLDATDFEQVWRRALRRGVLREASPGVEVPSLDPTDIAGRLVQDGVGRHEGLEAVIVPDPHLYDGRHANNGWLQELPHPITKTAWGNPAWISQSLASRLGLSDGQVLRITVAGQSLALPILVVPGQAPDTITLTAGHGHSSFGRNGSGVGVNVYRLRSAEHHWILPVNALDETGESRMITRVQLDFDQRECALAREFALIDDSPQPPQHSKPSRAKPRERPGSSQAWAMAIDLDRCTGCQACVIACQAENNVPFVGAAAIRRGRAMHWLRVDRYFETTRESVRTIVQPVPCQHCENAPCEAVCPVGATVHSPEGLNDMVYNRCVGSRYCANNCPYEVRRFNYLEYNAHLGEFERLRMNPDVTVRSRGVMEKCTFCVQRIESARISAKQRGSGRIEDGSILTACEQSCATKAITFGDLADHASRVSRASRDPRAYRILEDINTEPRVHYLARVRNPLGEI